jgi:hypothetical protein
MMARTTRHLITSVTVCVSLWVGVSHAIVWGVPDGNNHPNVGALFVKFDPVFSLGPGVPAGVFPVCSGSVIAKSPSGRRIRAISPMTRASCGVPRRA